MLPICNLAANYFGSFNTNRMSRSFFVAVLFGWMSGFLNAESCVLASSSVPVSFWQEKEEGKEATQEAESDQDKEKEEVSDSASVRGKIEVPAKYASVSFVGMEVILEQQVQPPKLPLPENFMEMEITKRQKWYQDFLKTDEGKAYQKKANELHKNRLILKTKIGEQGTFSFKKVPFGTYLLQGNKEFKVAGKKYIAGIFGEIPIKDVKHVELDRMPVDVIRLLEKGDQAPDLRLKVLESKKEQVVKIEQFAGKRTLVYFWTMESNKHARSEMDAVAKAVNEKKLSIAVIGVNLDRPSEKLTKYLQDNKFLWNSVQTSGLESSPVVEDFGISAIPSIWLITQDGKIELTDEDFIKAMSGKETRSLLSVLEDVVAGKDVVKEADKNK